MRFVLFLYVMVSMAACTTRKVQPTRESQRTIDTMYQQRVIALQPVLDSVCKIYGDSIYQAAVDSLMKERLAEMESLVK